MPKKGGKDDDSVSSVEIDDEEPDAEEDEEASNDLNSADIVTKYRTAGDIANKTVAAICEAAVVGATALSLCNLGG